MKLTAREIKTLKDIATYTKEPTEHRHGYSKFWTPKTHQKLHEKGLVDYVFNSVVINENGLKVLDT